MRPLGRSGINVSALCLGTMMYGDQVTRAEANHQMDRCFERGINFFDTAEFYTVPPKPETQGESERIVGDWIKAQNVRDKIVLATKVAGRSGFTYLRENEDVRVNAKNIRFAVERSLRNLSTDYIDLYQIHWPDRKSPMFGMELSGYKHYDDDYFSFEEAMETFAALQNEGKILHFGVSNETAYGVMKMAGLSDQKGLPRPHSIQNAYNLVNRNFEIGLAEVAMQENVGLLAYSPIAQGALTGKYLNGEKPAGSRGALFGRLGRYETPSADQAIQSYVDLAKSLDLDPAALAMQFVTTREFVTSNIFGARNDAQLDVIFDSLDVAWTDEIEAAVNKLHGKLPSPCP